MGYEESKIEGRNAVLEAFRSGKTIDKLLNTFETEMNILHKLSKDDIEAVVGKKVAIHIVNAREGKIQIHSGGGGNYGKIEAGI